MSTQISASEWKTRGKYFKRPDGHSIFYVEEGEGLVILFLHGFPTSSWDWSWVWPSFSGYRLLAIDFLGYGYSDKPKRYEYSVFDQADMVEEVLQDLNIDQVYLIAHDFGDSVAQELLHRSNNNLLSVELLKILFMNGGLFMKFSSLRPIQKILLSPLGFLVSSLPSFNRFKKSFSEVFSEVHKPTIKELEQFWSIICFNKGHRIAHKLIRYI